MDTETKLRSDIERNLKNSQMTLSDLQMHTEEQTRNLDELNVNRQRLLNDNDQLKHQLDDLTEQLNNVNRIKAQYVMQIEEEERMASEETSETMNLNTSVKNLQHEADRLRG